MPNMCCIRTEKKALAFDCLDHSRHILTGLRWVTTWFRVFSRIKKHTRSLIKSHTSIGLIPRVRRVRTKCVSGPISGRNLLPHLRGTLSLAGFICVSSAHECVYEFFLRSCSSKYVCIRIRTLVRKYCRVSQTSAQSRRRASSRLCARWFGRRDRWVLPTYIIICETRCLVPRRKRIKNNKS